MVYGVWDATMEGLVYQLTDGHLYYPKQQGGRLWRPGVPVELCVDPSNGAGVYAANAIQRWRGRVLLVDEFHKLGGTDEDFRDWLEAQPWRRDVEDGISDYAKPDTIKRLQYWGYPVRGSKKKKNVTDQINAVKQGMSVDPGTGLAQLVIDAVHCPHIILEMRKRVYRSPNRRNPDLRVPEAPVKAHDHHCNGLEYWYMEKLPFGEGFADDPYPDPVYEARAYMSLYR
jgi:hypothetical protein